jgi:ankyrin repeat protein
MRNIIITHHLIWVTFLLISPSLYAVTYITILPKNSEISTERKTALQAIANADVSTLKAALIAMDREEYADLLHVACRHTKNRQIITTLLKIPGIDIDSTEPARSGWTPLHEACLRGNTRATALLLHHSKTTFSVTTMIFRQEVRDYPRGKIFLTPPATNKQSPYHHIQKKCSPLHAAVIGSTVLLPSNTSPKKRDEGNYLKIIKQLCQFKQRMENGTLSRLDPNAQDAQGNSSLHLLAMAESPSPAIINYLLSIGADLTLQRSKRNNRSSSSPLDIAKAKNNHIFLEVVSHLFASNFNKLVKGGQFATNFYKPFPQQTKTLEYAAEKSTTSSSQQ